MNDRVRAAPGAGMLLFLGGCRRAPAFNVLGSFFPGWILCMVAGILVTVAIRVVLYKMRVEEQIKLLPLVYTCLAVFFACVFWLLFFE